MPTTLPQSGVLVPLYIYPLTPNTWDPLYHAITTNPHLPFLVIINPNSGPGALPSPDANYARELARLHTYPNVRTVGYIRIDYCRKPLSATCDEIDRYATWAEQGLGVGGIMVDETPNHYHREKEEYLLKLRDYVKGKEGLGGEKLVVHNPGTPPDVPMANAGPDLILVCEEPYARYQSQEVQHRLRELHYHRDRCGYMVTEVPDDVNMADLVRDLRDRATWIFVTEIVGDFYERFGPTSWGALMKALSVVDEGTEEKDGE
ncbi:hypothetical protein ASPCADRAFT_407739 [Aspergillus carbonarius ITEM 5010]|uniref:Cell surface protein n=1 Tax=Aspergillus carbonarius (strain ITEM 5010) TaxID=602072 RepID=A0A1R3RGG4_ASPC5|nr:hypothetical protein ASPCADRAFT_407739 [Aspergillus carbonarius ITEM 5010]